MEMGEMRGVPVYYHPEPHELDAMQTGGSVELLLFLRGLTHEGEVRMPANFGLFDVAVARALQDGEEVGRSEVVRRDDGVFFGASKRSFRRDMVRAISDAAHLLEVGS